MWFIGLDWADEHHDICVITDTGKQIGSLRIAHSPQGFENLKEFLYSITGPVDKEEVACIVETNHGLLISWLLEAGYPVYPVNPKTIDRHRRPSGAKTDKIDAYLLAKYGRSEMADLRRLEPDSAIVAELKALTRDQDSLVRSQTRLVNQLTACNPRLLPCGLETQELSAATLHSGLFAGLPHPTRGDGCFDWTDCSDPQGGWSS